MRQIGEKKEVCAHTFHMMYMIFQGVIGAVTGLIGGLLFLSGIFLLLDYQIYYECGSSMEPSLPKGSLLLVQKQKKSCYQTGDIITFSIKKEGKVFCVTHRIRGLTQKGRYLTRGDANRFADLGSVSEKNIRGKVVGCIPYYGYICRNLRRYGLRILIVLFFLYGRPFSHILHILSGYILRKRHPVS